MLLAVLLRKCGKIEDSVDAWHQALTCVPPTSVANSQTRCYAPEDIMVQCAWTIEQLGRTEPARGSSLKRSELLFQEVFRSLTCGHGEEFVGDLAAATAAWTTSATMWIDRATYHHSNKDYLIAVSHTMLSSEVELQCTIDGACDVQADCIAEAMRLLCEMINIHPPRLLVIPNNVSLTVTVCMCTS